jgi:serine/threonine-protein kinase RsbT
LDPIAAATEVVNPRETIMMIVTDHDIIAARQQGRTFALQLGFSWPDATLVATAISELARNIFLYAKRGEIVLRSLERDGRSGVLVIARDEGPGMPDIHQAAPTTTGVGLGLRGMTRLVDELEIESRVGQGTTVAVKKWKSCA